MAVKRMDNVGIVVDHLDATVAFFRELGLEPEGQATIEGDWAERVTGLHPMRASGRIFRDDIGELSRARGALSYYPHDVWLSVTRASTATITSPKPRCGWSP